MKQTTHRKINLLVAAVGGIGAAIIAWTIYAAETEPTRVVAVAGWALVAWLDFMDWIKELAKFMVERDDGGRQLCGDDSSRASGG